MTDRTILHIDTSDNQKIMVGITLAGVTYTEEKVLDKKKSQVVLPMIDELLLKYSVNKEALDAISVNCGPGSFTGLRVGITIANTLGTLLQIPINEKKVGELADAIYA